MDLSWSSSSWYRGPVDSRAVALFPHGVDGHLVKEVVTSMKLQRGVLLTSSLQVSPSSGFLG